MSRTVEDNGVCRELAQELCDARDEDEFDEA